MGVAIKTNYPDNVLMISEKAHYYLYPIDVAEPVLRLVALHDACKDPAMVNSDSLN